MDIDNESGSISPIKKAPANDNLLSELQGLGPVDMSKTASHAASDEYV